MRQTIDEIKTAFPREWVLIVDCEYDEADKVAAGRVAVHSSRRSDIYQEIPQYESGAIRFTGPFPKDHVVIL